MIRTGCRVLAARKAASRENPALSLRGTDQLGRTHRLRSQIPPVPQLWHRRAVRLHGDAATDPGRRNVLSMLPALPATIGCQKAPSTADPPSRTALYYYPAASDRELEIGIGLQSDHQILADRG